jgi:hypothetical protein
MTDTAHMSWSLTTLGSYLLIEFNGQFQAEMGFAILIVCNMIAASLAGPRGLNAAPPSNERGINYVK